MKNSIKRTALLVELTKQERQELAERYHFEEKDHPQIDTLYDALRSLTEAEVCYRIWPEIQKGKRAALCVVTLGAGVDAMQEIYTQADELLQVYILECLGSTMLEKAYEQVESILFDETGLHVSKYQFPGTDVALEQVRDILKEMAIQIDDMPVTCNGACMMNPKKSVVYIVGLEEEKKEACICDNCTRQDCAHRRERKRVIDYFHLA